MKLAVKLSPENKKKLLSKIELNSNGHPTIVGNNNGFLKYKKNNEKAATEVVAEEPKLNEENTEQEKKEITSEDLDKEFKEGNNDGS